VYETDIQNGQGYLSIADVFEVRALDVAQYQVIANSFGKIASQPLTPARECTRPLRVQCPLQASAITQSWVRYIHTTVPRASCTLHCTVRFPSPTIKEKCAASLTAECQILVYKPAIFCQWFRSVH